MTAAITSAPTQPSAGRHAWLTMISAGQCQR